MSWIVVAVASTAVTAYGQYAAGESAKDAADYNAEVARQRADATARAMEAETSLAHKNARRLKAEQRAAYSKAGAVPTTGTPLLVMMEQAKDMELDIMAERHNRMKEAQSLENTAAMSKWEGKTARRTAMFKVGATLLSGANSVGKQYNDGKQPSGLDGSSAPKNLKYRMQ